MKRPEAARNTRLPNAIVWPSHGACHLCGSEGALCRSHLVPKFVGEWLRDTGITRRLRGSDRPNKLVEDLPWRRLLCADCEALLSAWEDAVCTSVFLPLHEGRESRFRYGPWFPKFVASVAWRALVKLRVEGSLAKLAQVPTTPSAEQTWREFLLGKRHSPAPHELHALPLDAPAGGDIGECSPHLSRYLRRAVALSTQCHGESAYVVVKMARLLVIGVVAPGQERREWRGTKLHAEGGGWGSDSYHLPAWVFEHLKGGAQQMQDGVESLSPRQKSQTRDVLKAAIDRDPLAVAGSDIVKGFENDLRLFGRAAFQRPFRDDPE